MAELPVLVDVALCHRMRSSVHAPTRHNLKDKSPDLEKNVHAHMSDVARDDGVQLAADGGGEAHAVRGERERRAAAVLDDGQDVVPDRCEWSPSTAVSIGTD